MPFSTSPSTESATAISDSRSFAIGTANDVDSDGFVDRRGRGGRTGGGERRQFGSSHAGLSADGRELATAIDKYKVQHHRRYITCDEMLKVLGQLGYAKT